MTFRVLGGALLGCLCAGVQGTEFWELETLTDRVGERERWGTEQSGWAHGHVLSEGVQRGFFCALLCKEFPLCLLVL